MKKIKRPNKLSEPYLSEEPEELLRLMKRKPSVKETQEGCLTCGGDHLESRCPCLDKIPPGVEIDGDFDEVCRGCGRIGVKCCSKGAYAVYKSCCACGDNGHWYWENMCPDKPGKQIIVPSIEQLEEEVMKNKNKVNDDINLGYGFHFESDEFDESDESDDGRCGKKLKLYNEVDYDSDDGKKFRLPHILYDPEELLRLMTRKRSVKETQEGCLICGGDHLESRCPCLDKIPPGVEIDGDFDEVCLCCGRIGETCCSKGAYAVYKSCCACGDNGHWYWENMCPNKPVKQIIVPSIEELKEEVMKNKNKVRDECHNEDDDKDLLSTEQSLDNSLQNKEEDQVMVDLGKDNKNKDDCGKEHEAKRGNEPSDQSRFKGCKAISELEPGPVQGRENLFSLPKHLPSIKELRLLLIGQKLTIDEAGMVSQFPSTTQAGLPGSEDV